MSSFLEKINRSVESHGAALSAWSSLIAIVTFPLLMLGGVLTYQQVGQALARPDVTASFGSPKEVQVAFRNPTDVLARQAVIDFVIFDLDAPHALPDGGHGSVPITSRGAEFIRPNSGVGYYKLGEMLAPGARLVDGHTYFGVVGASCAECPERHEYWLLWKKGEGAWFAELGPREDHRPTLLSILGAGQGYPVVLESLLPAGRRRPVP